MATSSRVTRFGAYSSRLQAHRARSTSARASRQPSQGLQAAFTSSCPISRQRAPISPLAVSTRAKCSIAQSEKLHRAARTRRGAATARTPRSEIRTATSGCCRRLPRDCPDAWTPTTRSSPRQPSSPQRGRRARRAREADREARCGVAQLVRRVHRSGAGRQAAAVMSNGDDGIGGARRRPAAHRTWRPSCWA